MTAATEKSVLGRFDGAPRIEAHETTRLIREGEAYLASVQGADGARKTYAVTAVIGVEPLQQYLVKMPDGRQQVLGWSWDTRPRAEGGQRWFHLYEGQGALAGSPLHFLSAGQTWNSECADCHVTGFRKTYDQGTKRYDSRWAETGVGCEACHGPASRHLLWAQRPETERRGDASRGLAAPQSARTPAAWQLAPGASTAKRTPARKETAAELDVCARCHAHRNQFSDQADAGQSLLDAYLPSLLTPGLYWPNGGMRAEVYNHGSFLQSKMHQNGVTCSDCHLPHSARLKAEGNALCSQCHVAARFDTPAHHHHIQGEEAAQCAACHMPKTTFMRVDPRHDHSFSVPRPDISLKSGAPDACSSCHSDKPRAWVAEQAAMLFPGLARRAAPFASAMTAAHTGDEAAARLLLDVVRQADVPMIQRASALSELARRRDPAAFAEAARLVSHADPMMRHAASEAMAAAVPSERARVLGPLVSDSARAVRMSAARWLAGPPERLLNGPARSQFERALAEYIAAQRFNADRPDAHNNLATLFLDRGDRNSADRALRDAAALDPDHIPTLVNRAELARLQGRESEVGQSLRHILERAPGHALANHSLGLSLIRQKRAGEALALLQRAAEADPATPRYAYVYAVALDSQGQTRAAIDVLAAALLHHPNDPDITGALRFYRRKVP